MDKNISDSYEWIFKTMERYYTPPITYQDGQLCDQAKSVYREEYYYSDDIDVPEIGGDYMMHMINTKVDKIINPD